jgi:hypothetical protein
LLLYWEVRATSKLSSFRVIDPTGLEQYHCPGYFSDNKTKELLPLSGFYSGLYELFENSGNPTPPAFELAQDVL